MAEGQYFGPWDRARDKLIDFYGSLATQFVGIVLSLSVATVGAFQVFGYPKDIPTSLAFNPGYGVWGFTAFAAFFALLNAMYWNRVGFQATLVHLQPEPDIDPKSSLHRRYTLAILNSTFIFYGTRIGERTALKTIMFGGVGLIIASVL